MTPQLVIGTNEATWRPVFKVPAGSVGRCGDHGDRLDTHLTELLRRQAERHDVSPTEWSVQTTEQRQEDRAPALVVGEGDLALASDGGDGEIGRTVSGLQRRSAQGCCHVAMVPGRRGGVKPKGTCGPPPPSGGCCAAAAGAVTALWLLALLEACRRRHEAAADDDAPGSTAFRRATRRRSPSILGASGADHGRGWSRVIQ